MMNSVFTKTLYDKRWFMFGWLLGFAALAALLVIFYPSMHQEGSLDALVNSMPPAMQGFVGDLANLQQFSTYLASQLFDIRMQIIAGVMVVILALGLTVGEEEKGQLRTTLSLPLSRTSVLMQKWLAMLTIIAITLLGTIAGIYGAQFAIGESIEVDTLVQLVAMTWLIMVTFATLTFAAGIAAGDRAVGTLVGIFTLAGSFILSTFAVGVDWLKDYEMWSLFYYFPAVDIAKNGVDPSDVAVLGTISIVALLLSWLAFRRRDVR